MHASQNQYSEINNVVSYRRAESVRSNILQQVLFIKESTDKYRKVRNYRA